MSSTEVKARLAQARSAFRAQMEQAGAARVWESFPGRIAAVLSGGGAHGAYEAGALLAFQDAALPTHVITATSVGSINAASYAAHSETLVGGAESLVETWFGITPPSVGIEWTRYLWVIAGLLAASAGFGNLLNYELAQRGFQIHLHDPALTWLTLGLAGTAVLLFYDRLPYLGYVVQHYFRRTSWKPEPAKAALSLVANAIVWTFLIVAVHSLHIPSRLQEILRYHFWAAGVTVALLLLLVGLERLFRARLSAFLHRLLRQPLRPGLFVNFERGRLLRRRISAARLLASPIRVLFTATNLESGRACFFSNTPTGKLAADPGADPRFVTEEVSWIDDPIRAAVASSALPIVYEPLRIEGRLYADGGIVTNQPIRPAVRLGADVLFLVMIHPAESDRMRPKTFVDVGLRALDILMLQNLVTDLRILTTFNATCEKVAREHGLTPEEVEMNLGARRYRFVKAFTIRPAEPLPGTVLDFGSEITGPAILRGYLDAQAEILKFLAYAPAARFHRPRRAFRLAGEYSVELETSGPLPV